MYLKYLKYKNKYLELKNMIGGAAAVDDVDDAAAVDDVDDAADDDDAASTASTASTASAGIHNISKIMTAFNIFKNFFNEEKNIESMLDHMNKDEELRQLVLRLPLASINWGDVIDDDDEPLKFKKDDIKNDIILKKIFCAIISKMENITFKENCLYIQQMDVTTNTKKTISWIIKSYIGMTIPNINTLPEVVKDIAKYGIHKIKKLDGYEPSLPEHNPNKFLRPLASEIVSPLQPKSKEEQYLDLLKKTCILNTDELTIHLPTTKEESISLGRNTRWCTATHSKDNLFEHYNTKGPLYIIIPKNKLELTEKYQLHGSNTELMNENNRKISLPKLLDRLNDEIFNVWFYDNFYINIYNYFELHPKKYSLVKKINLMILDPKDVEVYKLLLDHIEWSKFTSLTHLIFEYSYNKQISVNFLPQSLKHITFGYEYNTIITPGVLPPSLTHLTFGHNYDKLISPGVLPQTLTHLTFGHDYDKLISAGVLPQTLTHLTFGDLYNKQIGVGVLRQSLTHLTFGKLYNEPIGVGVLPQSLTHLTFGEDYDEPIDKGALPKSLTHLTFGDIINHLG